MRKFEYVGPHDAVEVAGLGVVEQGETVEVEDVGLADGLADQPDNWKHHPNTPAKKEAKA